MKTAEAIVDWIRVDENGNLSIPAPQVRYSTVSRFESLADQYPTEAWSVVVENLRFLSQSKTLSKIRFLVEGGPDEVFTEGARFDLYEGEKLVAKGVIQ